MTMNNLIVKHLSAHGTIDETGCREESHLYQKGQRSK